ncbi:MAG TPA: hypothetical protein VEJ86_13860 [Candidatus Binataceae bacterium]|nr:hypothetical protein [Candidatus Binataceae bacterium]
MEARIFGQSKVHEVEIEMKRNAGYTRPGIWQGFLRRISGAPEVAIPLRSVARECEELYHLFD